MSFQKDNNDPELKWFHLAIVSIILFIVIMFTLLGLKKESKAQHRNPAIYPIINIPIPYKYSVTKKVLQSFEFKVQYRPQDLNFLEAIRIDRGAGCLVEAPITSAPEFKVAIACVPSVVDDGNIAELVFQRISKRVTDVAITDCELNEVAVDCPAFTHLSELQ